MSSRNDTIEAIRQELGRYPVLFTFGQGGKHPFVLIEARDGRTEKVTYSATPRVANHLKVRGDLRRALRRMSVEPYPDERRAARLGTLGAALMEAVAPDPVITEAPAKKETPMASATVTPIKSNGASPADKQPRREYTKLHRSEVVQLTMLISQHATVDFSSKTVEYADDWNDDRLLALLKAAPGREKLTLGHIKGFRTENFGFLKSEREGAPPPEGRAIGGHVAALKRQVASIEDRVRALEDALTSPKR